MRGGVVRSRYFLDIHHDIRLFWTCYSYIIRAYFSTYDDAQIPTDSLRIGLLGTELFSELFDDEIANSTNVQTQIYSRNADT